MEIRFTTKEFEEAMKALDERTIRRITNKYLSKGAGVITTQARKNLRKILYSTKEQKAARKAAKGKGIQARELGIITVRAKGKGFAASRVSRLRARTGKRALDEAYILWFIEKGAVDGGTRNRYTGVKGKAGYQLKNRGRLIPRPFFEPAKTAKEAEAYKVVKEGILKDIDKAWKG